ncbi:hypothetical protein A33M_2724 [Rhodovulum sp. PH10]|nr:hypothetical protein A33M_2724 [Rhodovulum sp. PH10]
MRGPVPGTSPRGLVPSGRVSPLRVSPGRVPSGRVPPDESGSLRRARRVGRIRPGHRRAAASPFR